MGSQFELDADNNYRPIDQSNLSELESSGKSSRLNIKRTLCRRLAQCLNPQLPAGVHLNTLKIYDSIFSQLNKESMV